MYFPSRQDVWIPLSHLVDDVIHQLEFVFDVGDFDVWQGDPSRLEALILKSDHADVVTLSALVIRQVNPFVLQAVKYGGTGVVFGVREKPQARCS
jgi:hypothetical protein